MAWGGMGEREGWGGMGWDGIGGMGWDGRDDMGWYVIGGRHGAKGWEDMGWWYGMVWGTVFPVSKSNLALMIWPFLP